MPVNHQQKRKEIWPLLIEKGMAKAYGGYNGLRGGTIDTAYMDLTGGAAMRIDFTDPSTQHEIALYRTDPEASLFGKLKRFIDDGFLLGAATDGTEEVVTECKIVKGHAYAVLDIVSYDGQHLIQLKNPWGRIVSPAA
ncbi:MAG: C2 family cysteine protease [Candidatus Pacebacteria bacterium]|nr:C2 family cysteine protease [Candidatus Paceibacterota bacterium]